MPLSNIHSVGKFWDELLSYASCLCSIASLCRCPGCARLTLPSWRWTTRCSPPTRASASPADTAPGHSIFSKESSLSLSVSICLSIYTSFFLSIYLSIYLYILFTKSFFPSSPASSQPAWLKEKTRRGKKLYIYISFYLNIYLPINLSIYLSVFPKLYTISF